MSDGIEIPTEVLGAAVVAQAMSPGGSHGEQGAHGAGTCANCGTALTGRYCAQCGQPAHVHRSLLHMFEELLHGIFHFETKAWRTLPLLMFRPGRLTREYIDGKRARYVGPLPLFMFMMFAMFMSFSLTSSHSSRADAVKIKANGKVESTDPKEALKIMQAELKALPPEAERTPKQAEDAKSIEAAITAIKWAPGIDADDDGKEPVTQEKLHERLMRIGPWLATPTIEAKLLHANQNKELALYKIKNGAAKYAILLVPITLPFLWLMFIFRRRFKMFDHAVFSFYSLSAIAVMMCVLALLGALDLEGTSVALVFIGPPLHIYKQLRGTYELTRFAALWRTFALLFYASIAMLLYFLIVIVVSM